MEMCLDHAYEVRRLVCCNGAIQYKRQCVICGVVDDYCIPHRNLTPRQRETVLDVDRSIRKTWCECRREEREQEREARIVAQKGEYREVYLRSAHWRNRRRRAMTRAMWICEWEENGKRCTKRAQQVHHLTYDRIGEEDDADLMALCAEHHAEIHEIAQ